MGKLKNKFLSIWRDPVWSKVFSVGILGLIALICGLVREIISTKKQILSNPTEQKAYADTDSLIKIKSAILDYEEELQTSAISEINIMIDYIKGRALRIPKQLEVLKPPQDDSSTFVVKYTVLLKEMADNLSLYGLIILKKIQSESEYYYWGIRCERSVYNIILTKKGSDLLVGDMSDSYVLAQYDLRQIDIFNIRTSNDTMYIYYTIPLTGANKALKKVFLDEKDKQSFATKDSFVVIQVKKNNEWVIVDN